jgi:predicted permease
MESVLQDIRYGLRMLKKSPAFAIAAVLTLALGIGANTAIFSLINALLLKTLPVRAPQELVIIGNPGEVHSRSQGSPVVDYFSVPLYRDLEQGSQDVFSGMLASAEVHLVQVSKDGAEIASNATAVLASDNYFSVLGVNPIYGRVFTDDGARGDNSVVLSYGFWQQKFGGRKDIIGQTILAKGHPYTVIGVAPPGFFGDIVGDVQDFWVPLPMEEQLLPGRKWLNTYSASWVHLIARLRPGVTEAHASSAINVLFQQLLNGPVGAQLNKTDRDELSHSTIQVSSGAKGLSELRMRFFAPLMLLVAIVSLVLLMACCNVANLLLARNSARRREFAVRMAIGAAPSRILRQLLTEGLVLATAGGLAGLALAHWGTRVLLALSDNRDLQATPDARVMLFTAATCVVTGLLFGIIPAWTFRRVAVAPALKPGGQSGEGYFGRSWTWNRSLVAIQVSISFLVLFGAGLLTRSLSNLRNVDLGYAHEHVLLVRTDPVGAGYSDARGAAFADEMITKISGLPGVRAVTYSKNGLFSGSESDERIEVEGFTPKGQTDLDAATDYVGPGYFGAIGIPILLGRDISAQDTQNSPRVAVINQTMAKFYFGDANPVGHTFRVLDDPARSSPIEIVGVSKDVRDHDLKAVVPRRFYVPYVQSAPSAGINLEIRCAGDPAALSEAVRKQIRAYDPNVPTYSARSLDELVSSTITNEAVIAWLSGFFGLLGLTLACVGLYGVMSYTVGRQTREIGVRMALGAQRSSMLYMVLADAGRLVIAGMLAGIPLALAGGYVLASLLYGLRGTDPITMLLAVLVLAFVALLAAAIPARRAAKVDPMVALRYE